MYVCMYVFSGEINFILFGSLLKKTPTVQGEQFLSTGSKLFPYTVELFSEEAWCAEKPASRDNSFNPF